MMGMGLLFEWRLRHDLFNDPKEQIIIMMGFAPGEIRKVGREKHNALIYRALEK